MKMDIKNSFIHTFDTRQNCYIYDVNTNSILKINKSLYEYINKRRNDSISIDEELEKKINEVSSRGYLLAKRVEKMEHSISQLLPYVMKNRLNNITSNSAMQLEMRLLCLLRFISE